MAVQGFERGVQRGHACKSNILIEGYITVIYFVMNMEKSTLS